jgi:glycosyltransferase involved in cell wall biosynthesis
MGRVKDLDVLDNFCPLGVVPAHDLAALTRYSSAIIDPSLFEGWSTTVEEAKSLGKHVVLSDIPVHREQNPVLATFFSPEDTNALPAILWEVWNKLCSDELQRIEYARRVTDERRLEFARKYQKSCIKL